MNASDATPWLLVEVVPVRGEVPTAEFEDEVRRVAGVLGTDADWAGWWAITSKAPVLDIVAFVTPSPGGPFSAQANSYAGMDEQVRRGRKRHRVQANVDPHRFFGLDAAERREVALPMVLELIHRAVRVLRLSEPPAVPIAAMPPPLPAGTLRRRRLRELRQEPRPASPARQPLTAEQVERQQAVVDVVAKCHAQPASDQAKAAAVGDQQLGTARRSAEGRWLRRTGSMQGGAIPKGYKFEIARLMQALSHDQAWAQWWAKSGLLWLDLAPAYMLYNEQELLPKSDRVLRRGDHAEATLRVVFGPFDHERWSTQESQEQARKALAACIANVGRRLKIGAPPPLPE